MTLKRSLKEHFRDNFQELFTWRIFAIPVGAFLIVWIREPEYGLEIFSMFLRYPLAWLLWLGVAITDAMLRAIYGYARERKPRYIKRMQTQDDRQAAKVAQERLGAETAQSNAPESRGDL